MKILHTSDWHLGKRLENRSRIKEQAEVLDEIIEIAERENVELVLVAGDVFDTFVPTAEAEELFYEKITKLCAYKRAVVVISGNHDDAERLCAPIPFAEKMGIYIVGNINNQINTVGGNSVIKLVESGMGYMIFENSKKERVFIKTLPYPTETRYKEGQTDETFEEKMTRWLNFGLENACSLPKILVGHFFVAGGKVSDSERQIDQGGVRAVSTDIIPAYDYVAMGHLHKKQKMSASKNVYYSGSILQYSFDEAESKKSVYVLNLQDGKIDDIKEVQLTKGVKLKRLTCFSEEEAYALLDQNQQYFTELTLKLNHPISDSDSKNFRKNYKNLLLLNLELQGESFYKAESKKHLKDDELFKEYYKSKYGGEAPKELLEMFYKIMEED